LENKKNFKKLPTKNCDIFQKKKIFDGNYFHILKSLGNISYEHIPQKFQFGESRGEKNIQ